jgi:hypothetical protein
MKRNSLLLAVVSKIEETGGSVLHGVTPCLLLSTAQFTAQLLKSSKKIRKKFLLNKHEYIAVNLSLKI